MGDNVLIFAVVTTGAVLIVAHLTRMLRASMLHRTIREAISRDSPSLPLLLKGIEEPSGDGGNNDDRTGIVLVALGLALFLLGMVTGSTDTGGAGLFPALVGAALLLRYQLVKRRG
jgi:hypothetical protein